MLMSGWVLKFTKITFIDKFSQLTANENNIVLPLSDNLVIVHGCQMRKQENDQIAKIVYLEKGPNFMKMIIIWHAFYVW